MQLVTCDVCKAEIAPSAAACPKCGDIKTLAKQSRPSILRTVFGVALLAASAYIVVTMLSGGLERKFYKPGSNGLDVIYADVAARAENQYRIASSQGDKIQICVQAGLVAAAYLQAEIQNKYDYWKMIQRNDCISAGVEP